MVKKDAKLEGYRRKRKPEQTPEPLGSEGWAGGDVCGGVFVVHHHQARRVHFDLRVEIDGVLASWAVPEGVSVDPKKKRLAVRTEDHPLEYADFEGIIAEGGYGAGPMVLWDRGYWLPHEDFRTGLAAGKVLFELRGHKLRGVFTLVRLKDAEGHWLLIKKPDGGAGSDDFDNRSILSGLRVDELADKKSRLQSLMRRVSFSPKGAIDDGAFRPMLLATHRKAFSDPDWLYELKYDGYRMIARRDGSSVCLRLRSGTEVTTKFPEVVRVLRTLPGQRFLLDGEVVVLEADGRPSFQRLAKRIRVHGMVDLRRAELVEPAVFQVFDLLELGPYDLRNVELIERKEVLQSLVPALGPVRFTEHVVGEGTALFEEVVRLGLEGIVAKKLDSPYRTGRHPHWRKIRNVRTAVVMVVGHSLRGKRLRAIAVAGFDGDQVVDLGRVGSGFSEGDATEILQRLGEGEGSGPLIVEVQYLMRTTAGRLRHPVFIRIRDDAGRSDCVIAEDEPTVALEVRHETVEYKNREKCFWPERGYTKGDLIDFYVSAADWILPYLEDRPVVLTRYPDGINGDAFFQRNVPTYLPSWVRRETHYSEERGEDVEFFVVDDVQALCYLANLGTIVFHMWGSRLADLSMPDWCILDLDPKNAPFSSVVAIAKHIKNILDEAGLPAFVKTSGGTGLHVMVPMGAQYTFKQCRDFSQLVAAMVVTDLPEIATIERTIENRQDRVYIDTGQNGHGRVLVAPFSVRPTVDATVSTPLEWREVNNRLDVSRFNIKSVPRRLKRMGRDPLRTMMASQSDLEAALELISKRLAGRGR